MNARKTLANRGRILKKIDMETVYELLDQGWKVEEVAKKYDISKSTLYRRHREYQEELKQTLPPLPEDFSVNEK